MDLLFGWHLKTAFRLHCRWAISGWCPSHWNGINHQVHVLRFQIPTWSPLSSWFRAATWGPRFQGLSSFVALTFKACLICATSLAPSRRGHAFCSCAVELGRVFSPGTNQSWVEGIAKSQCSSIAVHLHNVWISQQASCRNRAISKPVITRSNHHPVFMLSSAQIDIACPSPEFINQRPELPTN